ncbi:MAG: hypothetical protein ACKOXM_02655 [Agromyces sp.]
MNYVGIPIAMLVMYVAQNIEARLGVAAAGWFAALPISFAVATASIAITNGEVNAAAVAVSAVGHVGPMIAYGMVFVNAAPRWGMLRGFAISAASYALISFCIAGLHPFVNVGIGILALAIGNWYQSRRPAAPLPSRAATRLQRWLSLLSAGAVVAILTVTNQYFGAALAGALGAFPVMSTTIAFAAAPREGAAHAVTVMAGVARSLPIYLTYGVVFAVAVTLASLPWAVVLAVVSALGIAALTRKRPARRELSEDDLITSEP